jgi:hypothetical protein
MYSLKAPESTYAARGIWAPPSFWHLSQVKYENSDYFKLIGQILQNTARGKEAGRYKRPVQKMYAPVKNCLLRINEIP